MTRTRVEEKRYEKESTKRESRTAAENGLSSSGDKRSLTLADRLPLENTGIGKIGIAMTAREMEVCRRLGLSTEW